MSTRIRSILGLVFAALLLLLLPPRKFCANAWSAI